MVRRRFWTLFRWWASIGFRRETFFRVFGFLAGIGARKSGRLLPILIRLVRIVGNLVVGAEYPMWLDACMVAWFVSGNLAFLAVLHAAAVQTLEETDSQMRSLRTQRAQLILASARSRHEDLNSELAVLEKLNGGPCTPPIEAGSFAGLV